MGAIPTPAAALAIRDAARMPLRVDDIVECTEPRETELGPIAVGERHTVAQVSAAGCFFRLHGSEAFTRSSGWKRVGRIEHPGGCAPPVMVEEPQAGRFRKKPVVIEAFRLGETWPDWWAERHIRNEVTTHNEDGRWGGGPDYALIHTLEGVMRAEKGDWIIKGVAGEIYPCKPDIFAATYEPVEGAA